MRILIVEDQEMTANALKNGFERERYAVDIESDGERGLYRAKTNDYDLILLDNVLPGKTGAQVCKEIREYKLTTPILILSAQSDTERKVNLLNDGADDYLTKPYSFRELFARVHALLRRPRGSMEANDFIVGNLILNRRTYTASRNGTAIKLTPKEFAILEYLMKHPGEVISRSAILEHAWDEHGDLFSNSIETHISNLRNKIDHKHKDKLLHTISGRGYKIEAKK